MHENKGGDFSREGDVAQTPDKTIRMPYKSSNLPRRKLETTIF
jgi:hypothetical protein